MTISATKTVRELAVEVPSATRIFEKLGIDYCCGGGKMLQDACSAAGVPVEQVIDSLEKAEQLQGEDQEFVDWQAEPLSRLISYILDKHHTFTRQELDRLEGLLAKVVSAHGERHPELQKIQKLFRALKEELLMHMFKEEQILFPYIFKMDEASSQNRAFPLPPFGTVHNPIRVMMMEHDGAGEILRQMRELSTDYSVPADGCISYQTLYQALEALEQDLHQHIHLENNILFPRAAEMESRI